MHNESALDKLTGTFQILDLQSLLLAARGEVDLALMFKQELASRGMDYSGKWIGFDAVYDELFSERELCDVELLCQEQMFRDRRIGDTGAEKSSLGKLGRVRTALLKKKAARELAAVTARKARQAREARS
jgi:hypothetical protein